MGIFYAYKHVLLFEILSLSALDYVADLLSALVVVHLTSIEKQPWNKQHLFTEMAWP